MNGTITTYTLKMTYEERRFAIGALDRIATQYDDPEAKTLLRKLISLEPDGAENPDA